MRKATIPIIDFLLCFFLLSLRINGLTPAFLGKNIHQTSRIAILSTLSNDDGSTTLEVCLSPGCLADGAQATLQKLQALIPEERNITVQKGVCCSLCGNGPVVLYGNQKTRKVSSSDKILKVLKEVEGDDSADSLAASSRSQKILESFDWIDQARSAAKSRDFAKATELFQQAVDIGMAQYAEGYSLRQVEYLIGALQDQVKAFLQMPGKEAKENAIAAAQKSVDLISVASGCDGDEDAILLRYSSLECLQEAIETFCTNIPKPPEELLARELATLQELLRLELSKVSTLQQNKRRSLGFRLQKLEKEVK
jgi:hypothetical protein